MCSHLLRTSFFASLIALSFSQDQKSIFYISHHAQKRVPGEGQENKRDTLVAYR
jgi:hypothetical protein